MSQDSTGSLIIPPRSVATGSPAGDALENVNTNVLANGAMCYVGSGAGQGVWQLEKGSSAAPGASVVTPLAGPGRWFLKIGTGPVVPSEPLFATLDTLTEIILSGTPQTLITMQLVYQPNVRVKWSIALESNPATPGAPGAARFVLTVPGSGFSERGNNWEFSRAGASAVGKLGCSGDTVLVRPDISPGATITLNLDATGLDTGAGANSLRAVASSPPNLGPQYMLAYAQSP